MGVNFEEVLIALFDEQERRTENGSIPAELILQILYFVRNVGDVMNLNLKDDDFRKIIGTFYTDMVNNVMHSGGNEQ